MLKPPPIRGMAGSGTKYKLFAIEAVIRRMKKIPKLTNVTYLDDEIDFYRIDTTHAPKKSRLLLIIVALSTFNFWLASQQN